MILEDWLKLTSHRLYKRLFRLTYNFLSSLAGFPIKSRFLKIIWSAKPIMKFLRALRTTFSKHPCSCWQISVLVRRLWGKRWLILRRIDCFCFFLVVSLYIAVGLLVQLALGCLCILVFFWATGWLSPDYILASYALTVVWSSRWEVLHKSVSFFGWTDLAVGGSQQCCSCYWF